MRSKESNDLAKSYLILNFRSQISGNALSLDPILVVHSETYTTGHITLDVLGLELLVKKLLSTPHPSFFRGIYISNVLCISDTYPLKNPLNISLSRYQRPQ